MHIFWAITGIVFLFLDIQKSSTNKLIIASSCLFDAIVATKLPQEYIIQIISFCIFYIVFSVLIKVILKKEKKDYLKLKKLDDIIGNKAIVAKDIAKTLSIDGFGYIKYDNELYPAKSIDDKEIKSGEIVEIVSVDNKILNVKVKDHANK